jgi:transglutaminase-like putative cysteine protease
VTKWNCCTAVFGFYAAFVVSAQARAETPAWLQLAAGTSPLASGTHATVLLDEVNVTVGTDGKARTVRRYAVRIHDSDGRDAAAVREVYVSGSGNVRSMRGWLLRRSNQTRELGGGNIVDAALVGNDMYNDVRVRLLRASDDVSDGDVFGAEVESEERLLFAQFEWSLQDRWPVVLARRTVTLPEGWRARAITLNARPIAERTNGRAITWEVGNLPEIPEEPAMPPVSSLAARLVVSVFGNDRQTPAGQFDTWQDVSRWADAITLDQSASPALLEKARTLTGSASSELERIAAVGRYVQHVQYVSIQTGIGRGGGYQPHAAPLVLERNYGDCKDKANLMRALLAAVGIKAYLVLIYSGDRDYVRADWPSPQQFNHAIVAVAVHPETTATAVFEQPSLGRLLFFDPTAEYTPLGELPLDEQGSFALVVSPQNNSLTRVPVLPRESNRLDRSLDGAVAPDGGLVGRMRENSTGARASESRAVAGALEPTAYRAAVQRRLTAVLAGAVVSNLMTETSTSTPAFTVTFDVAAPRFAQHMGSLLLLKFPFGADDPLDGITRARQTPVVLEPELTNEAIQLRLPAGFAVDELPQAAMFEESFGRYSLSYTAANGSIVAHRTFDLRGQTVDAAQHAQLLAFFSRVRAADASPVVLKRQ